MTDKVPDIDPEAKREELIEDAEEAKAKQEQEFAAVLDAVREGEEFVQDETEWVEIGEAEFEVQTDLPGETLDLIQSLDDDVEDMPIRELLDRAADQVETIRAGDQILHRQADIDAFFDYYYRERGLEVLAVAATRLFEPAINRTEQRVPKSFRGE